MKYTIEGFNQEEALKLQKQVYDKKSDSYKIIKLDCIDLVILRWIVDFEPKMTKKIIDNETYFWINYQSLLEALPILEIKKRMLCYRLEKICDIGILKHKNIKEKGNYSYYSFGENYTNLVQKNAEPCVINCLTLTQNIAEQNNSSIKETHLLNNSKEKYKKEFLSLLAKFKIDETINAREAQVKLKEFLEQNNSEVKLEEKVDNNGIKDYSGRIDIVGEYYDIKFAIEFDNVNPREKSIYKISHFDCDLRFVLLRENTTNYKIGDIYVIGVKNSISSKFNEELFKKFWNVYPKKISKGNAEKWFIKNKPSEELVNDMISKLELLKETEQWKQNNGQYIPYPATWLNAKGWEDEVETEVPEWFGKEIKESEASDEEIAEMEKLLEEFK